MKIYIIGRKQWLTFFAILCIIILGLVLWPNTKKEIVTTSSSNKTISWGLGYGDKGEQPTGNVDKAYLKKFNAYYVGDTGEKVIYITFDAGYENGYTEKLLDVLKKQEVPAAFFLVSHYIKENEELVKRMVEEGHLVCNHTTTHPDMTTKNREAFQKELEGIEVRFKELTGKDMPKYYRPPEGKFNESNLQYANELGYSTILWSLAYVDWQDKKQPTRDYAFSKLLPRIHDGAIVLLHSNSKTNADILDELITKWKEEGYTFKSLDDLSAMSEQ